MDNLLQVVRISRQTSYFAPPSRIEKIKKRNIRFQRFVNFKNFLMKDFLKI